MIIRFLAFALGSAIGQMMGQLTYIFVKAFVNGFEQYILWSYELTKALCIGLCVGFTTASTYVVVAAALETRRRGAAKVRIW